MKMVPAEPMQSRATQEGIMRIQKTRITVGLGLVWMLAVGTVTLADTYDWISDRGRFEPRDQLEADGRSRDQ